MTLITRRSVTPAVQRLASGVLAAYVVPNRHSLKWIAFEVADVGALGAPVVLDLQTADRIERARQAHLEHPGANFKDGGA